MPEAIHCFAHPSILSTLNAAPIDIATPFMLWPHDWVRLSIESIPETAFATSVRIAMVRVVAT